MLFPCLINIKRTSHRTKDSNISLDTRQLASHKLKAKKDSTLFIQSAYELEELTWLTSVASLKSEATASLPSSSFTNCELPESSELF